MRFSRASPAARCSAASPQPRPLALCPSDDEPPPEGLQHARRALCASETSEEADLPCTSAATHCAEHRGRRRLSDAAAAADAAARAPAPHSPRGRCTRGVGLRGILARVATGRARGGFVGVRGGRLSGGGVALLRLARSRRLEVELQARQLAYGVVDVTALLQDVGYVLRGGRGGRRAKGQRCDRGKRGGRTSARGAEN